MKKFIIGIYILLSISLNAQNKWVATWATAIECAKIADMPNTPLTNNTLRQVIRVSLGGEKIRLQLTNELNDEDIEIKSIYISDALTSDSINPYKTKYLTFSGKKNIVIKQGIAIYSDPLVYDLEPLARISITINYGKCPTTITTHRGSRTTSYIMQGESKPKNAFIIEEKVEHWYTISALEVEAPMETKCIACIGNSITDGRGTTTDANNRWTDILAEAFQGQVGVLNLGIGGNCVLQGGLGIPAISRFHRDVLSQQGVTDIIIFEGINDIGGSKNRSESVTSRLLKAYSQMIDSAHTRGLNVYGGTLTPFQNTSYWSYFHEAARMTVNEWIRSYGNFDGVIDFDKQVQDPQNPNCFHEDYQSDWLHPNPTGYRIMGEYAAKCLQNISNNIN